MIALFHFSVKPELLNLGVPEIDYSRAPCVGADQKTRGLWNEIAGIIQLIRPTITVTTNLRNGGDHVFTKAPKIS